MGSPRQMQTARARAQAMQRLQAAHPDDWEQFYGDAREAEGLPREVTRNAISEQNRILRYRLAELEDRLAAKESA